MIAVDLAAVKQVVSKVLYEAINVLSKSFMGFLGKICLSRRVMHCAALHLTSKWVRINVGLLCLALVGLLWKAMERQSPVRHPCCVTPKSRSAPGCRRRDLLPPTTRDPSR